LKEGEVTLPATQGILTTGYASKGELLVGDSNGEMKSVQARGTIQSHFISSRTLVNALFKPGFLFGILFASVLIVLSVSCLS
jgi:hypothetical protein